MAEYKCGDCVYADLCEKSEMLLGFSRDNPAYCRLFFNSADVVPVRHGRLSVQYIDDYYGEFADCMECGTNNILPCNYCRNCGAKMDGGNDSKPNDAME